MAKRVEFELDFLSAKPLAACAPRPDETTVRIRTRFSNREGRLRLRATCLRNQSSNSNSIFEPRSLLRHPHGTRVRIQTRFSSVKRPLLARHVPAEPGFEFELDFPTARAPPRAKALNERHGCTTRVNNACLPGRCDLAASVPTKRLRSAAIHAPRWKCTRSVRRSSPSATTDSR